MEKSTSERYVYFSRVRWYYHNQMTYKSTAILNKEGKWFVARSAELGVVTQGRTIEEAKKNLEEAVGLFLEDSPSSKKILSKTNPVITSIEVNA